MSDDGRIVVRTRIFRRAGGGKINDKVSHIVWINYRNEMVAERQVFDVRGKRIDAAPWTLRQAEQLVETGHWEVEDTSPDDDDKPDVSYGVEAW
jgi:hypothetical protein